MVEEENGVGACGSAAASDERGAGGNGGGDSGARDGARAPTGRGQAAGSGFVGSGWGGAAAAAAAAAGPPSREVRHGTRWKTTWRRTSPPGRSIRRSKIGRWRSRRRPSARDCLRPRWRRRIFCTRAPGASCRYVIRIRLVRPRGCTRRERVEAEEAEALAMALAMAPASASAVAVVAAAAASAGWVLLRALAVSPYPRDGPSPPFTASLHADAPPRSHATHPHILTNPSVIRPSPPSPPSPPFPSSPRTGGVPIRAGARAVGALSWASEGASREAGAVPGTAPVPRGTPTTAHGAALGVDGRGVVARAEGSGPRPWSIRLPTPPTGQWAAAAAAARGTLPPKASPARLPVRSRRRGGETRRGKRSRTLFRGSRSSGR